MSVQSNTLTNRIKNNPEIPRIMKGLMSVLDFARHKNVSRTSIYDAIESGRIVPVLIGVKKEIYIDSDQYTDITFKKPFYKDQPQDQ